MELGMTPQAKCSLNKHKSYKEKFLIVKQGTRSSVLLPPFTKQLGTFGWSCSSLAGHISETWESFSLDMKDRQVEDLGL
jgi:hypothetical protein